MVNPSSQYVDSAPGYLDKGRARQLLNKWRTILEFEDKNTAPIEGYQKQLATAMVLENQENSLRQSGLLRENMPFASSSVATGTSTGLWNGRPVGGRDTAPTSAGQYGGVGADGSAAPHGSSDWYAPGDARLPKTLIPMIRRTFPELITHEIVGVQPMSGPVGLAFALRYQYDQDPLACSPYNDKGCTLVNGGAKTFPTGHLGSGEAGYNRLFTSHTGISSAQLSGNADFALSTDDAGVAQLMSQFEGSSNIPTMSLKIEKTAIEAGTRRLGTSWTMEAEQDLMNMNGIDIDAEMTNMMSYEIQAEIDREMVVRMIQVSLNAGRGAGYSIWKPQLADARWFAERGIDFYAKIVVEANRMAIRNRRGPANFIVATPKVCTILQLLPEFKPFEIQSNIQVHPNGVARVGSLAGQFSIYRDTRTEAQYLSNPQARASAVEYALLGYKGSEFYDTGIVYCPYIPVLVQRTMSPHSFTPNVGMMTRYGVVDSLWGASNFYHLIIVKDVDQNHYSSACSPVASACGPIYSISN